MKQNVFNLLIALIAGFLLGIMIQVPSCSKQEVKVEYVPKYDTVTIEKDRIVEHTKLQYVTRIDTFYMVNLDTVFVQDLPIEQKIYSDTITTDSTETIIKIQHQGFLSEINNVYLSHQYNKEKVTIPTPTKRVDTGFFIGPSVGYNVGVSPTGTLVHGPSVGINIGWGLTIRRK